MKISKITKALPLAVLALAFCAPAVMADDQTTNASTVFQLELPKYLKITSEKANITKTVTYDNDYAGANLEAMTAKFTVITNDPAQKVYLQATCIASGGTANALFSPTEDPAALFVALSNEGAAPEAATVAKATSATKSDTPNVILLGITPSYTHDNFGNAGVSPSWDNTNGQAAYVIKNGTATLSYLTGTKVESNSFSTHDTYGTYKATLTMTQTSL